jgi:tRNA(Leu) C34 or U34 (ribose-2'-O)-methylase TrmL
MGHPDFWRSGRLILVAAGLQDPGNLGTLVRSAEAFGVAGVLTTPGTVSGWNQKALRASAGSVFRLPVVAVGVAELAALKQRGVRLLAAVGSGDAVAAQEVDFSGSCALMIGNEGVGLSDELLELADERVTIPCPGRVESLNAAIAGSLLLYEASRQRAEAGVSGGKRLAVVPVKRSSGSFDCGSRDEAASAFAQDDGVQQTTTTVKGHPGQRQGSLHSAADDEAVHRSVGDDVFFLTGEKAEATAGPPAARKDDKAKTKDAVGR